jgi:hypothetical protein
MKIKKRSWCGKSAEYIYWVIKYRHIDYFLCDGHCLEWVNLSQIIGWSSIKDRRVIFLYKKFPLRYNLAD